MRREAASVALPGARDHRIEAVLFPYDQDKVLSELRFMEEYWLGRRAPIPTTTPRKCAACAFNLLRLCAHALGPFIAAV
jgi:CRISPR/Cas system-associated exonuclease Cas4 (RecB family)